MTAYLFDVNALIALAWPSHIHHHAARRWFAANSHLQWATCPLTESGFIRISSNPRIIADATSPHEARSVLSQMCAHPRHVFWNDNLSFSDGIFSEMLIGGHRQMADAYLLATAFSNDGKLVTFDQSILSIAGGRKDLAGIIECIGY